MIETVVPTRAFEALANKSRRQVCLGLLEQDSHVEGLDPLTLVDSEKSGEPPCATQIELHHAHLPKLDELGLIDWDRSTGEIERGPNWDEIAPLLRLIRDHRDELPAGWVE